MTAKEIVGKKPLTRAELEAVKAKSPKVRAYSQSLEEQGIKFEVVKLTTTEVEDETDSSDSQ